MNIFLVVFEQILFPLVMLFSIGYYFCFIFSWEETVAYPRRPGDDSETARRLKLDLAFRMLSTGSRDMVPHALLLLPNTKVIFPYFARVILFGLLHLFY